MPARSRLSRRNRPVRAVHNCWDSALDGRLPRPPSLPSASPATSSAPVGSLLLDRMTTVLRRGQDLAIRGRLRLTGAPADAVAHSSVALFAGAALGSRAMLHAARDATDGQVSGNQIGDPVPVTPAGEFAITVPADQAPWQTPGVYPLTLVGTAPSAVGPDARRDADDVPAVLPRSGAAASRLHPRPAGDGSAGGRGTQHVARLADRAGGRPRRPARPAARFRGLPRRAFWCWSAHARDRPVAPGQSAHDEHRRVARPDRAKDPARQRRRLPHALETQLARLGGHHDAVAVRRRRRDRVGRRGTSGSRVDGSPPCAAAPFRRPSFDGGDHQHRVTDRRLYDPGGLCSARVRRCLLGDRGRHAACRRIRR